MNKKKEYMYLVKILVDPGYGGRKIEGRITQLKGVKIKKPLCN